MAVSFEGEHWSRHTYNAIDIAAVSLAGVAMFNIFKDKASASDLILLGVVLATVLIRNALQRWAYHRRMTSTEQEMYREVRSLLSWRPGGPSDASI